MHYSVLVLVLAAAGSPGSQHAAARAILEAIEMQAQMTHMHDEVLDFALEEAFEHGGEEVIKEAFTALAEHVGHAAHHAAHHATHHVAHHVASVVGAKGVAVGTGHAAHAAGHAYAHAVGHAAGTAFAKGMAFYEMVKLAVELSEMTDVNNPNLLAHLGVEDSETIRLCESLYEAGNFQSRWAASAALAKLTESLVAADFASMSEHEQRGQFLLFLRQLGAKVDWSSDREVRDLRCFFAVLAQSDLGLHEKWRADVVPETEDVELHMAFDGTLSIFRGQALWLPDETNGYSRGCCDLTGKALPWQTGKQYCYKSEGRSGACSRGGTFRHDQVCSHAKGAGLGVCHAPLDGGPNVLHLMSLTRETDQRWVYIVEVEAVQGAEGAKDARAFASLAEAKRCAKLVKAAEMPGETSVLAHVFAPGADGPEQLAAAREELATARPGASGTPPSVVRLHVPKGAAPSVRRAPGGVLAALESCGPDGGPGDGGGAVPRQDPFADCETCHRPVRREAPQKVRKPGGRGDLYADCEGC